jgi:hypothetical protein
VDPDGQHDADERQDDRIAAGPEPDGGESDQRGDDQHEPEHERPPGLHVVGAGGGGRGVAVADVHQPVPERPPHLDGRRGVAHVLE